MLMFCALTMKRLLENIGFKMKILNKIALMDLKNAIGVMMYEFKQKRNR